MARVDSGTDAPRPTRVVAVTRQASLSVALAYIERTEQWEVVTVSDVDEALAADAHVAVVALDTVEANREAVSRLRGSAASPACIVITDDELPADGSWPAAVLVRPFTLEELTRSVVALAPAPVPQPVVQAGSETVAAPVRPAPSLRSPKAAPRPKPRPKPNPEPNPEPKPAAKAAVEPVVKPVVKPAARPQVERPARPAAPPAAWDFSFDPTDVRPTKPVRLPEPTPRRVPPPVAPIVRKSARRTSAPANRDWPTEGPLARRARPYA